jgi:hypothetical protein
MHRPLQIATHSPTNGFQFLEVKEHINEISKDGQIQASAKQIKFLQNKSRAQISSPDSHAGSDICLALIKLREFLPPRHYCDRLVAIYMGHFERTFRVLHIPTFMKEVHNLWTDGSSAVRISASTIPILTLIMTMAYHMDDKEQVGDDQMHRSYLKNTALDLVQAWLDELTRKQRTELSTLQVEMLLILSRTLRHIHPEKLWSSTGALVRSAMMMGLHINPSSTPAFTPFIAEMRRRLWTTVIEIDLQASMVCGMPLVVPEVDPSSLASHNLNDADFSPVSPCLPASKPLWANTDSIFQVVLASSLPQRIRALLLVQQGAPNIQEGLRLGRDLEEVLALKPKTLQIPLADQSSPDCAGTLLHCVLLDQYLRRPILCLYKPLLVNSKHVSSALSEIQRHCLDSSLAILSYQDAYTIAALTPLTPSPRAHQNFFYRCCKTDVLWAALTLCEQLKQNRRFNPAMVHAQNTVLVATVERTISCLIERIAQKGSDLKDIVFLAVVLRSVREPAETPAERARALRDTARDTMHKCRDKLLEPLVSSSAAATHTQRHAPLPTHVVRERNHSGPFPGPPAPFPFSRAAAPTPPAPSSSASAPAPVAMPENTNTNTNTPPEQWFGDLPDLAAEFSEFQPVMFDRDDPLNFGIAGGWEWERMWQ